MSGSLSEGWRTKRNIRVENGIRSAEICCLTVVMIANLLLPSYLKINKVGGELTMGLKYCRTILDLKLSVVLQVHYCSNISEMRPL